MGQYFVGGFYCFVVDFVGVLGLDYVDYFFYYIDVGGFYVGLVQVVGIVYVGYVFGVYVGGGGFQVEVFVDVFQVGGVYEGGYCQLVYFYVLVGIWFGDCYQIVFVDVY